MIFVSILPRGKLLLHFVSFKLYGVVYLGRVSVVRQSSEGAKPDDPERDL